jgi:hypothetical protein
MTSTPGPRFDHLVRMSDHRGVFEHARFDEPRRERGYCTDDVARVLVVTTREPDAPSDVRHLAGIALRFLADAQSLDGAYRNRMNRAGQWEDQPTVEDCWGRSLWGLGTAAAHTDADWVRQSATVQFERAARQRSPWPRSMAFAALGAAEMLARDPGHLQARALLTDAADGMAPPGNEPGWPWPEPRLAYANAVLPEAMIAGGTVLDRPVLQRQGLDLLAWLLDHETVDGHLSVTPVGGGSIGDHRPAFDQQPIEVAALADACARAATVDGDPRWIDGLTAAAAWFFGENDGQRVMCEPQTGAGFDGLQADGVNRNQGTESTLALLSTLQHARRLVVVPT